MNQLLRVPVDGKENRKRKDQQNVGKTLLLLLVIHKMTSSLSLASSVGGGWCREARGRQRNGTRRRRDGLLSVRRVLKRSSMEISTGPFTKPPGQPDTTPSADPSLGPRRPTLPRTPRPPGGGWGGRARGSEFSETHPSRTNELLSLREVYSRNSMLITPGETSRSFFCSSRS